MSSSAIAFALEDRRYRGEARLLYIAAADSNGTIGHETAAYWLGLPVEEAAAVLKQHADAGMFIDLGNGRYAQPDIIYFVGSSDGYAPDCRSTGYKKRPVSKARRARILKRDGGVCHYCGSSENLTIDHIVAEVSGGAHTDDNLVACCRSCNSSKGTKSYDDFLAWRAGERD